MSSPLFAVYGASGCGRGIMPLAREQLRRQGVALDRLVFVDDGAVDAAQKVRAERNRQIVLVTAG